MNYWGWLLVLGGTMSAGGFLGYVMGYDRATRKAMVARVGMARPRIGPKGGAGNSGAVAPNVAYTSGALRSEVDKCALWTDEPGWPGYPRDACRHWHVCNPGSYDPQTYTVYWTLHWVQRHGRVPGFREPLTKRGLL